MMLQSLKFANFADKAELEERLLSFIREWNDHAHPFAWGSKSAAKLMAYAERSAAA